MELDLNINICSCLLIDHKVIKEISEISEIYDKGIRHRDLNPSHQNILFDLERKESVVLDFGLSETQDSFLLRVIPKYLSYDIQSKKAFTFEDDL